MIWLIVTRSLIHYSADWSLSLFRATNLTLPAACAHTKAIEYMVNLTNALEADCWFIQPRTADSTDKYVQAFAVCWSGVIPHHVRVALAG